jgi:hypothetical protein
MTRTADSGQAGPDEGVSYNSGAISLTRAFSSEYGALGFVWAVPRPAAAPAGGGVPVR